MSTEAGAGAGSGDAPLTANPLDTTSTTTILRKLDSAANLAQIRGVMDDHEHEFDESCLQRALDRVGAIDSRTRRQDAAAAREVMGRLGAVYMHLLPSSDPVRSVGALHTFAFLGCNPGGDQAGLTAICRHMHEVVWPVVAQLGNELVATDMVWALARISHHGELAIDEGLMARVAVALTGKLPHMALSKVSKLAGAYSELTAGGCAWSLMDAVARETHARLQSSDFDVASCVNILEALARQGVQNDATMAVAAARLRDTMTRGVQPHHLATACKAFAQLKYDHEEFWAGAASLAVRVMGQLTAQQLQNIAWAFAVRGRPETQLYLGIAKRATDLMPTLKPVHVTMLIWSFGKQGFAQPTFLAAATAHMKANMGSYTTRNLANALWGLARLDVNDTPLFTAALDRAAAILADPEGRDAVALDPATGRETFRNSEGLVVQRWKDADSGVVMEETHFASGNVRVRPVTPPCPQFSTQNLADLAWAAADRGVAHPALFDVVAVRALPALPGFSKTSVVDLAWACAATKQYNKALFTGLEARALERLGDFGPAYLAELLWALAVAGHMPSAEFKTRALAVVWSRWARTAGDQRVLAKTLWGLLKLEADRADPGHPVFAAFNEILKQAAPSQGQQPEGGLGSSAAQQPPAEPFSGTQR